MIGALARVFSERPPGEEEIKFAQVPLTETDHRALKVHASSPGYPVSDLMSTAPAVSGLLNDPQQPPEQAD